jgi:hypothetical protein
MKVREVSAVAVRLEDIREKPGSVILAEIRQLMQEHPEAFDLRWVTEQDDWHTIRYLRSDSERGY